MSFSIAVITLIIITQEAFSVLCAAVKCLCVSQYCGNVLSIHLQSSFPVDKRNHPLTYLASGIPLDELSGIFVELIVPEYTTHRSHSETH